MKFYGQWNPKVDEVLYENYFKDKRGGFFIEAGAADGVGGSNCKAFEDSLDWKGINFEPARPSFEKLVKNRPNSINVNAGLGKEEQTIQFTDVISKTGHGAANGSFRHSDKHLKELSGYNKHFDGKNINFESYDAKVTTYKSIIEKHGVEKVDLLSLDVEGFEYDALDGMKGCDVMPEVICIEYSYLGLANVVRKLRVMGYHFDFISYNNAFMSRTKRTKKKWFGETDKECNVDNGNIGWKPVDLDMIRRI